MSALAVVRQVPKPILFGLFGGLGGFLAALLLGELLWFVLKPAPPVAAAPKLVLSASPSVYVYQGMNNKFTIQYAVEKPEGAVHISFPDAPSGLKISPITASTNSSEASANIQALPEAIPGTHKVKIVAKCPAAGGQTAEATTTIDVTVSAQPLPMVDIVIALDVTASMGFAIRGVQNGIQDFAETLRKKRLASRVALLAFRDRTIGEEPELLIFGNGQERTPFTTDMVEFSRQVGRLKADGGGDIPESSMDALVQCAGLPYREKATRVMILITDAPPKIPDKETKSLRRTADVLREKKIDQLHLVTLRTDSREPGGADNVIRPYETIRADAGIKGKFFDLRTASRERDAFATQLMPELSTEIATAVAAAAPDLKPTITETAPAPKVQSLQSTETYSADQTTRVFAMVALWTALIACAVSLLLALGQVLYQGRGLPLGLLIVCAAGGVVAGLLGGTAGQAVVAFIPDLGVVGKIFVVFGWVILGGLVGLGLSFVVPNLSKFLGLIGGALGGFAGVLAFLVLSLAHDSLGRVGGATALGLCIGAMVAFVEAAFRRAWLEVKLGPREVITLSLGPEPVKIGSDAKACTVFARGAASIALRYWIRDGAVFCHDAATGETKVVNGDTRTAGTVEVTVRTSTTGKGAPKVDAPKPTPAPVVVPPAPKPAPTPAAAPVSAVPVVSNPTPAKPTAPVPPNPMTVKPIPPNPMTPKAVPPNPMTVKPIVPPPVNPISKPPAPSPIAATPPKPMAPVPPPSPPATPSKPAAARCPECGAAIEGAPGGRICKACGALS